MASIEDTIREVQGALALEKNKQVRAAVELDAAKARVEEARTLLASEFGVTTSEEAKAKLTQLRSDLDTAIELIEARLAEAGA